MLRKAYYFIEANEKLAASLESVEDRSFAQMILEPALIQGDEADRTYWSRSDYLTKVKLLYLSRLREYTPFSCDSDAIRIFGTDRINEQCFDRFWSIQRFDLEDDVRSLEFYMKRVIDKVDADSSIIKEWIEGLNG